MFACVISRAGSDPQNVVLVVVDMRLAQQRNRHAAASSGVEMIGVVDTEAESEEFADSSDDGCNGRKKALVLFNCRRDVTTTTAVYHGFDRQSKAQARNSTSSPQFNLTKRCRRARYW